MSVSSSLTERLPPDILLSILYLLPHNDIISMRKTCRILAAISKRRVLWLNRVKAICEEDTVFLAAFPLDQMSAEELETVASGPTRFDYFAKRYGRTKAQLDQIIVEREELNPQHRRTFNFDISSLKHLPPSLLFNIPQLYLIPGGRFLVLSSRNILQLWDLGIFLLTQRGSRKDPVLLAQHVSRISSDVWVCTSVHSNLNAPMGNTESIRLIRYTPLRNIVQAVGIFPTASNPQFNVLRTAHTSTTEISYISVCGNLLVLACDRVIKIWDFVENTWACFGIKKEPIEIFLTPTMMALVHRDGVSLWDVPRLTTDGHDEEPQTKDPQLFMAFPSGSGSPEDEDGASISFFSQLCDWYSGSRQPLWLDYQREDQSDVVHRFLVEMNFSTFLQQNTPSLDESPTILLPKYLNCFNLLPSRVVGGKQVRMFLKAEDNGPSCHSVQEIDGVAQDVFFEFNMTKESRRPSHKNKTFDPFSGRFCYYPHLVNAPSMQIHVVDFFDS